MRLLVQAALCAAVALGGWPAVPAGAQEAKWVSLYTDRDGETFYDPASVTRTGGRTRLTLRMVAKSDTNWSAIARAEIDCKAQTMGMLSMAQYGAGPEPVRTRTVPADQVERQPLFVGEDMEPVYRVACPKGAPLPKFEGPQITVVPPPPPKR